MRDFAGQAVDPYRALVDEELFLCFAHSGILQACKADSRAAERSDSVRVFSADRFLMMLPSARMNMRP